MDSNKIPKFNKLRSLLMENGDTYKDLAILLDKSVSTIQQRINGQRSWEWDELQKIRLHYQLSDDRFLSIFFEV